MKLKELITELQYIQSEVGDGPPHEGCKGDVEVLVNYSGPSCQDLIETDLDAEISGVEPSIMPGCGCWNGAYIIISVKPTYTLTKENKHARN